MEEHATEDGVSLRDSTIKAFLYYSVFPQFDAITRSIRFHNPSTSTRTFSIEKIMSATVDFPPAPHNRPHYFTQFSGAHARERHVVSRKVEMGLTGIGSRRGISSAQQNPFVVISEG